jgi:hypothetical protein
VPNQLKVGVYNEAGELVKLLFEGGASEIPGRLSLSASSITAGDPAGVGVILPGTFSATGPAASLQWDLSNSGGQLVSAGIYYVKAEYRDPFGHTSSFIEPTQVLATGGADLLRIYNSAGELVWTEALSYTAAALDMPPGFVVEQGAAGAMVNGPLGVKVIDRGGAVHLLDWDGRNAQGNPLDSGTYLVQLVAKGETSSQVLEARSVTLLKAPNALRPLASARLAPNPLRGDGDGRLDFDPVAGGRISAQLYSLAGELVLTAHGDASAGTLALPVQGLAGGVFVVRVTLVNSAGTRDTAVLKWACVH